MAYVKYTISSIAEIINSIKGLYVATPPLVTVLRVLTLSSAFLQDEIVSSGEEIACSGTVLSSSSQQAQETQGVRRIFHDHWLGFDTAHCGASGTPQMLDCVLVAACGHYHRAILQLENWFSFNSVLRLCLTASGHTMSSQRH